MPVCDNCKTRWSWKQTLKKSFVLTTSMECPNCGKKQYLTRKSRKRIFIFNLLIISPLLIQGLFDIHGVITIALIFLFFICSILLMPLWMEVQNDEEFLW